MKNKTTGYFDIYRYQILPINRFWTKDIFESPETIDELLKLKNKYFYDAVVCLDKKTDFDKTRKPMTCTLINYDQAREIFLFQFAVERSVTIGTPDFKEKKIENWPRFLVFFWNNSKRQYLLVQKKNDAFVNTITVVKSIESTLNRILKIQNLRAHIEPLFEERYFWDTAKHYQENIQEVRFELITPNMANISGSLNDALKNLAKDTNSTHLTVALQSDKDSVLKLSNDNSTLEGLVAYASNGGGNITFKAKKISRFIRTNTTKKQIEIEDLEIHANISLVPKLINYVTKLLK